MDLIRSTNSHQRIIDLYDDCINDLILEAERMYDTLSNYSIGGEGSEACVASGEYVGIFETMMANTTTYTACIKTSLLDPDTNNNLHHIRRLNHELSDLRKVLGPMANQGCRAARQMMRIMVRVNKSLIEVRDIEQNRNDDTYALLYDQAKNSYYESDEWIKIKDNYVDTLKTKWLLPYCDAQDVLRDKENEILEELSERGPFARLWSAYRGDSAMMGKSVSELCLYNTVELHDMFCNEGKLRIIQDFCRQYRFSGECYILPPEYITREVRFKDKKDEKIFGKRWPYIYKYMKRKMHSERVPAYAWCCLNHVLCYFGIIEEVEFSIFMKWLNEYAKETLITPENIRQVKNNYFVRNVSTKWVGKDYYDEDNTNQSTKKFRRFAIICDELKDILQDRYVCDC